jgi:sec-independent protein translocase protein TatA
MFRNPTTDLIVVLVIVLLIFGPKRLPGLGKQLGQGLREFKDSITGDSDDSHESSEHPQLGSAADAPLPSDGERAPAASAPTQPAAQPPSAPPASRDSAEIGSERRS